MEAIVRDFELADGFASSFRYMSKLFGFQFSDSLLVCPLIVSVIGIDPPSSDCPGAPSAFFLHCPKFLVPSLPSDVRRSVPFGAIFPTSNIGPARSSPASRSTSSTVVVTVSRGRYEVLLLSE